jgi:transposase InsO family protein
MSLNALCGLFGKTRQGYYKQGNAAQNMFMEQEIILSAVKQIRSKAKTTRWGGRKLQDLLKKELYPLNMSIGRDKLFDLLRANHMLVRHRKRKYFTTQSHHWLRKYDNLIQDKVITQPNQLWVADITYVKSKGTVYFLYIITDAYSQKIVGCYLSLDLKAASAERALDMAIKNNTDRVGVLIHHSDRGVQYCSAAYVEMLEKNNIAISMTKPASPQENAIAERINGILKDEWLYDLDVKTLKEASKKVKEVIGIYNGYRPHNTLNNQTPNQIHDLGFLRHKAERVIGKTYRYRKRVIKNDDSSKSDNAIGQTIIPQVVAPQQSCRPLDRCKTKLKNLNEL